MARADTLSGALGAQLPATAGRQPAGHGTTVHVVSRLTPPVLRFLQPTVQALGAVGTAQLLVVLDDGKHQMQRTGFPATLRQHLVPDRPSPWQRSRVLYRALVAVLQDEPVAALHLHGVLAGVAGLRMLRRLPAQPVDVYFTPHRPRNLALPSLLQSLLLPLLKRSLRGGTLRTIVNLPAETSQPAPVDGTPAWMVECAVPALYFETRRNEAKRPLLIAATAFENPLAVDRFVRVAVLLGDDSLGIAFNWLGATNPKAATTLRAAGVGQFMADTDAQRAQRLGAAWVFVAAVEERGFPVRLVEAMAAGLACVAQDSPSHRHVVDDGVTGYLCADVPAMLQRIADLVDDPALRHQLGQAARAAAAARFSDSVFERRLLQALGHVSPGQVPACEAQPTGGTACC